LARYGLDLQRKYKDKKRKTTILICVFLCFVIVLGSVSTLLLWKSLNYDFNNIFKPEGESTTAPATTEKIDSVVLQGESLFLVAVTSDDGKETRFMNFINIDLSKKTIKIIPIDHTLKSSDAKISFAKTLETSGAKDLVSQINSFYGVTVDRYAVLTDSGYKSVYRALGDITIKINEDLEYDTPDMFLELKRGDNVLTPEKTFKYMKYICETEKGYECSKLNSEIIVASFNAFFNNQTFLSADSLFSKLINYCTTDITIVDYTDSKDEIEYLLPKTSKEKLKVFVSEKEF
jgi:anionic cell wall polymer biosynthesis LytR-Cps2A-Psr (LCP) family protein